MKILIACEELQRVCIEMRRLGHEAYSCDVQECSGGHPEWHILGDAIPYINGNCTFTTCDGKPHTIDGRWDMLIAHPPCTYLSQVGARWLFAGGKLNQERYQNGLKGKYFFMAFLNAECDKICVENPVPSKVYGLPKYTQIVQPYYFGDPYSKKTCLWLKGLPKLKPTDVCKKYQSTSEADWFQKGGKDRQKNRSKTFPGIAKAMAEQWAGEINKNPHTGGNR